MLNKVCVITIKMNDIEEAVEFYTNVFDFKVSKRYGEKIVSLVHDDIPIVLEEEPGNRLSKPKVLPAILSADLDEDFALLKQRGANILFDEPKPCPPGRFIVVEDPSGNQIEVVEFSNTED